ncbi:hypothetical protein TIFTF001_006842 [Ficus carica]|uniref:Uncharacterized protein n=1 Tax=Ficus carica TaxID=3494 RepID=A0AA88AC52_FICCA|nr:hypothetical protein TIFTF001_006842 [Ficus carica]
MQVNWSRFGTGIASRSAAALCVGCWFVRWWRLRWDAMMGDGDSGGLGKLGSRFSFVIDVRLLFFDLQENGGCDGDLVIAMLSALRGHRRWWAASSSDLGSGLG